VKIENITGVSLTTRRSSKKKGHLSVGNSLLGKIVIDDEGVLAVVSEVLTDGATSIGGQELERSSLGGGGGNDDRELHAVSGLEKSNDVGDGGSLLTDSTIDAVKGLAVVTHLEDFLLVEDGVDGDSGLSGLLISNNKLTLTSSDWHE